MQKIADAQGLKLLISAVGLENVFSVAQPFWWHRIFNIKRMKSLTCCKISRKLRLLSLPYASFNGDSVLKFALANLSQSLA
jgi:PTS system cellobiose-specific IIB component